MKPVTAWPDFAHNRIFAVGDDGQIYTLVLVPHPVEKDTDWQWKRYGPPMPDSDRAKYLNSMRDDK